MDPMIRADEHTLLMSNFYVERSKKERSTIHHVLLQMIMLEQCEQVGQNESHDGRDQVNNMRQERKHLVGLSQRPLLLLLSFFFFI